MGVVAWHRTHAPVWWLCGGEEAHGGGGFAPVPALEHVEGDNVIPSGEHVEAYGTIGLEHALVLQLPAAGEHGASAQERDDIMRGEHSAAFFAARSHGEPAFPARRRSNPAGVSNKRCKVAQAESNGVCRHEVQGRPGRPYAEHAEFAKLSAAVAESTMHTFAWPHVKVAKALVPRPTAAIVRVNGVENEMKTLHVISAFTICSQDYRC